MGPRGQFRTLRGRLLALMTGLVCLVVLAVSMYLFSRQSEQLAQMRESSKRQMRAALEIQGLAIARNVARASERALATLDFLFVSEIIQSTVDNDQAITYGIVMDHERRAVAHTSPSQLRQVLDDSLAHFAAKQRRDVVNAYEVGGRPMLEAIVPLVVGDKQWSVRFGLTLDGVNAEIAEAESIAATQARQNGLVLAAVTALLAALAIIAGSFAASRIVRPLGELTQGVDALRQGQLERRVEISGGMDELEGLARGFNDMASAVRARDEQLRDKVTEVERALAQAEEANRVKSEFLANISHELRTPLNAIVNVPSALLREYETYRVWACGDCSAVFKADASNHEIGEKSGEACPDCGSGVFLREHVHCLGNAAEHTHFLGRLKQSGRHLLNVVNDLLDFSKLEAGKMNLFYDDIDVSEALSDLGEIVSGLAEDAGVQLLIESHEQPRPLRVDRVKVNQMLLNLVSNAIKFTPRGGRVNVRAYTDPGTRSMVFEVADTGIGIPADKTSLIFESFRQVDGSHTRSHGGTGLGLAITKQLVELHGGTLSVASAEGHGSTFTFTLPVQGRQAENDERDSASLEPARKRNQRVVVLDDDRVHLELTRLVLERAGYDVETLSSPEGALADVRMRPPHLVVLDVMLPGMSGLAMLRQLKADPKTRNIPIIVASAYPSNSDIVERLGGIWLPKPWDADNFLHVLATAVDVSLRPPARTQSHSPVALS